MMKQIFQKFCSVFFTITLMSFVMPKAKAAVLIFPQLDPTQIGPIDKVLAADLAFRPIEGAAPLTGIGPFGFSTGVSGVATETSSIQSIIGSSPQYIPGAFVNLALGLPGGFGVELGFIPSVSLKGTSFSNYGGDLRWNLSTLFSKLPIDLALRGMLTSASLSSTQDLNGVTISTSYKTTITGANLTLGKTFLFVEPYIGVGFANESSNLSYSGSTSLFNNNFASGTTDVPASAFGFWGTAGFQIRLAILQIGAEYATLWGNSNYSVKVALRF